MNEADRSFLKNLQDAGCTEACMDECRALKEQDRRSELLCLLLKRRAALLADVHQGQDRLECLDYLLYQLRKETKKP